MEMDKSQDIPNMSKIQFKTTAECYKTETKYILECSASSYPVCFILVNQVHLVYKAENLGVSRVLKDGLQTRLVIMEVALQFTTLDVKHVDEHFDVTKYAFSLARDVALHERLLPASTEQISPNANYLKFIKTTF